MKTSLELSQWGVQEMSLAELGATDGGFLPLLVIGAALLLGSCGNTVIYNSGGNNTNNASSSASADSSGNGSLSGNRFP